MDRIAVISDVHGNLPALEVVLNDIEQRGITRIFNLGDLVGKGPNPAEALDICRQRCERTVKGNWDDAILLGSDHPMIEWARQQLSNEQREYLAALPNTIDFTMSGKAVRLFHASQVGVHHRVHMRDTDERHAAMFTNTDFTGYDVEPSVVGYGDIHGAYLQTFYNKMLFNVGSVGNPLDMTLASYAILEGVYESRQAALLSLQIIRLPYDIELAVQHAVDAQMPELDAYANELRTARYRGRPAG